MTIHSRSQAIARVALRVKLGGHDVPEEDIRRSFERSRRNFLRISLPLADEWGLWDKQEPLDKKPRTSGHAKLREL